ncbi:MAG: TonB-dependent receptor [Pseudomonadota bacterium]
MDVFPGRAKIAILSLPFFIIILSGFGSAQDGSSGGRVEEIVVTATRSGANRDTVAANIYVIDREEMEHLPASSAGEVLQHVPGVYVEFNGGLGSCATARIQGCENRHVAIYQDGVPLNQVLNPLTELFYIPVHTIERIEVYKGPGSSSWGSSLGGVVNIITREPDPERVFSADITSSYGSFDTFKNHGTLSGTIDDFGYLVSLVREETGGYIEHTEYEQDAAYLKLNYGMDEQGKISFVFSHDKGKNADPVLNEPHFWDDVYRRRTYERLLYETSPRDDLVLTFLGWYQTFHSRIDDVFTDHLDNWFHYTEKTWGTSAQGAFSHETHALNAGLDANWAEYSFNTYGGDKYRAKNWAGYVNDTLNMDNLSLNAAVRYDHNSDFGSAVSPSGGISYRLLNDDLVIRAQVSRGFSAPPGASVNAPWYGNPDLKPEKAMNYQAGGEIRALGFLTAELNLFRSDVKGLIEPREVIDPDGETRWKCFNIARARRQGIEGLVRATFESGLALSLGGSFVDVQNRETDQDIKDIPREIYNFSASYKHGPVTHSLAAQYIFHNSSYPETRDRQWVFDYKVDAILPLLEGYGRLSVFGAIHNLSNSGYIYRSVFPQPDRWLEGGLNLEF